MSDNVDDRNVADSIKATVQEIVEDRELSRDDIYAPWGGIFRKKEPKVFPVFKAGEV